MKTSQNKLIETQSQATEKLRLAKEKSKKYYDRTLNVQNYDIGDKIYLLKDTKNSKLENEYSGPYTITQIFNDLNVEIDLGNGKRKIVHFNKLTTNN